jgi:ATP-dependent protease ClpP protease subunit
MDDKEIEPLNQNFYITPSNTKKIDVYLIGVIKGPQYYSDSMHVIRTANPDDEVNIYVNSPGGRLDTAVQFINAMSYCQAPIHIHIDDECISAATFIAMHGDEYSVNPHARFMFHNYSGGVGGKGGEIYDNAVFMRQWIETYYRDIYKDFLTDKEIEDILAGKDHYMIASDFVDRIQNKKQNQSKAILESQPDPLSRFKDENMVIILDKLLNMTFGDLDDDLTVDKFLGWLTEGVKIGVSPEKEVQKSKPKATRAKAKK